MIHFLSFASSNLAPTLKRIGKEAEESRFFDKIYLYDEHKLDKKFRKAHKQYFRENPRGYGYWIWKPHLILKTMKEQMADGDILVYLDAGCEIHSTGKKRWKEYIEYLDKADCILFDHENFSVKNLTKIDALLLFKMNDDEQALNRGQFQSGAIIVRKTDFMLQFIEKWYNCCEQFKTTLLCDAPSSHDEYPDFIGHRHDQSLLTLLCMQVEPELKLANESNHFKILEQKEFYSRLPDWSNMTNYPFWAKRNKEFAQPGWLDRAARKIRRFLNKS